MKTAWNKPQLVVLVRSKPEEAVLTACKDEQWEGGGPQVSDMSCHAEYPECNTCKDIAAT